MNGKSASGGNHPDERQNDKNLFGSLPSPQQLNIPTAKHIVRVRNIELGKTIGEVGRDMNSGMVVAVKMVDRKKMRDMRCTHHIKWEIEIQGSLKHPNIVQLYHVTVLNTHIAIVIEYAAGGDLLVYLLKRGTLRENETLKLFRQLINGLDYIHRHLIVHRDLKLENLLLDHENRLKIADFGLSTCLCDGEYLTTSCGSMGYVAPELLQDQLQGYSGPEIDLWSCGIILFTLLNGNLPFNDFSNSAMRRKIRFSKLVIPRHIGACVSDLIMSLLDRNPLRRATITDIRKHTWFRYQTSLYINSNSGQKHQVNLNAIERVAAKYHISEEDVVRRVQNHNTRTHGPKCNSTEVCGKRIAPKAATGLSTLDIPCEQANSSGKRYCSAEVLDSEVAFDLDRTIEIIEMESKGTNIPIKPSTSRIDEKPWFIRIHHAPNQRWNLGVVCNGALPYVMTSIFSTLKKTNYEWKTTEFYTILIKKKCKDKMKTMNTPIYKLQVFKSSTWTLDNPSYVLDFRVVAQDGPDNDDQLLKSKESTKMDEDQTLDDNIADDNCASLDANGDVVDPIPMVQLPFQRFSKPRDHSQTENMAEFLEICSGILSALLR